MKTTYRLIVGLILVMLTVTGCGSKEVKESGTKSEGSISLKQEREKQTLWEVLDEKGNIAEYLPETDKDVQEIMELIKKHTSLVDNRDYTSIDPEKEFECYTKDFAAQLSDGSYKEELEQMYKENKLQIQQGTITWYPNTFSSDGLSCKVTIDSEFQIIHSEKEYLDSLKMELNTVYTEQRIYYLEKQSDNWKIANITKSAVNKKSSQ